MINRRKRDALLSLGLGVALAQFSFLPSSADTVITGPVSGSQEFTDHTTINSALTGISLTGSTAIMTGALDKIITINAGKDGILSLVGTNPVTFGTTIINAESIGVSINGGTVRLGDNSRVTINPLIYAGTGIDAYASTSDITIGNNLVVNASTGLRVNNGGRITVGDNASIHGTASGTGILNATIVSQSRGTITVGNNALIENDGSAQSDTTNHTAIYAYNGSNFIIGSGSTIQTKGSSRNDAVIADGRGAFSSFGTSVTIGDAARITTEGNQSYGLWALYNAKLTVKNDALVSTVGNNSYGAIATLGAELVLGERADIRTVGNSAMGLYVRGENSSTLESARASTITLGSGSSIDTTGSSAHGVYSAFGGQAILNGDQTISSSGANAYAIYATGYNLARVSEVSSITATGGRLDIRGSLYAANSGQVDLTFHTGSELTGFSTVADGVSAINLDMTGSRWNVTDHSSVTNLINNQSVIAFNAPADPSQAASYKTLTAHDYVGNGGTLVLNTRLGGDGSASDRLVITGSATGQTFLSVLNAGGLGAETSGNGILVVEAIGSATTAAGSFQLGHTVAAGAYNYRLYRGGLNATAPDNWYLSSHIVITNPGIEVADPLSPTPSGSTDPTFGVMVSDYRPEVPLVASIMPIALEYGYAMLGTLHERVGDTWNAPVVPDYEEKVVRGKNGKQAVVRVPVGRNTEQNPWFAGAWGRLIGDRGFQNHNRNFERRGPDYDYTFTGIQTGLDVYAREQSDGTLDKLGIYVGYGQIDGNVKGAWQGRAGTIDMDAYTVGAYWTHKAAAGWYTDAVVQGTWYSAETRSVEGKQVKPDGFGILASLEAGYAFQLGNGFTLEPQAQLVYQNVSFDDVSDVSGRFDFGNGESLRGRLGMRLTKTFNMADAARPRLLTAWLRANIWHEFMGDTTMTASTLTGGNPYTVHSSLGGTWGEIGAGVSGQVSDNVALFATASYNRSLDNKGREAWNGRLGLTVKW